MPGYRWSCPACGYPSPAGTSQCSTCHCPASFSAADVERFRIAFLAQGGSIGPSAAPGVDEKDKTVLKILLAFPLLLLGVWPFSRSKQKEKSSHESHVKR